MFVIPKRSMFVKRVLLYRDQGAEGIKDQVEVNNGPICKFINAIKILSFEPIKRSAEDGLHRIVCRRDLKLEQRT